MKKRIICISLLLITLFSTVFPVLAESPEETLDLSETTVDEDFFYADFDADTYKSRFGNEERIITIREYGYNGKSSIYDLYVYVYLPELLGRSLAESDVIGFIYDLVLKINDSYYTLEYVDSSQCGDFFKFKLEGVKGSIFSSGGIREYELSGDITVRYYVTDYDRDETSVFPISSVWFKCSGLDAKDTYSMESNVQKLLTLDVKHTVYRTPTSEKGIGYHHDIFSVYFSVPNSYFTDYEYLKSIDIRYLEAMWNAIVLSDDKVKAEAEKLLGVNFDSEFNSSYPSFYVRPFIMVGGGLLTGGIPTADFVLNNKTPVLFAKNLSSITNVLKVPDYTDDDLFISGDDVTEYLPYAESEEYYGINNKTVEFDDTFDIASFKSGNPSNAVYKKLVSWFYKYKDEVALDNVAPIVSVDESFFNGFSADTGKWCADHLINPNDADAFKSAYNTAKSKNETLIVLRFAVRNYYASYSDVDTGFKWSSETNSFYAQGTGFRNFQVINLNFMKEGEVYVVPVYHDPIDINGGITAPKDTVFDDTSELLKELFGKMMTVIRLIMVLLLVVVLWQPVSTLFTLITVSVQSRRNNRNSNKKE